MGFGFEFAFEFAFDFAFGGGILWSCLRRWLFLFLLVY